MKKLIRISKTFGVSSLEYQKELKKAIKQINKLNSFGLGAQGRLAKAYKNLALISQTASNKQFRKAIRRALLAKSKYVAERLARTEMAKAYGATSFENFKEQKTPAYKSTLSSRHKIFDICDFHAKVDHYGLGRGVYPANVDSGYPFHPNCMCSLTPIFIIKEKPKLDKAAAKKYLMTGNNRRMLSKKDQKKLDKSKNAAALIPHYTNPKRL